MEQQTGGHTGTSRNKLGIQRESSRTKRFSRSAHKIELNEEQEARRVQVDTIQAIVHTIELNEDKKTRRQQIGTLQAIAHKIELNEEKEARRTGRHTPLQAVAHNTELNEEKEARRTDRHTPGGLGTGPNRREESETRQVDSGKASRTDMEEPVNAVTSIIRNIPRFDGTKPENYRDRCSKTRVVLSLSNQDVFSVLNGLTEPISAFADTTTPDVPTNLAEVSRWTRACENLFSILYLITGGPAAALVRQYKDRKTVGGLGNGQKAWNAFYAKYHNHRIRHGGPATRS